MRAIILSLALATGLVSHVPARGGTIEWQPYTYNMRDGTPVTDAERGRLSVPENHSRPNGNRIELSLIRFRSTASTPGPPIVWLAGGPGDFGSDDIEGPYLQLVREFQKVGDVIALDQRGTGLSEPRLTCPDNVVELPLDRPLDRDSFVDAYLEVSRKCAQYWTSQGVDLSAYNTAENADDIEDLRQALGVERVHLYGGSYGTHLGLAVIRRHPQSIDRAVLSGVEGPDQTWKLPSVIETHFAEVARAHGETIDLLAMMRRVLARLQSAPVTVDVESDDGTTRIVVGAFDLQMANLYFLGDLDNIRQLPEIYAAMDAGDYSLLGSVAMGFRRVSVGTAMYFCMDCASGATDDRMRRIDSESALPLSLVGKALNAPFPEVCEAWPYRELPDDFRSPLVSDLPVLFVSANLDGHTPISNTSELMPGFRRAFHIVVENATHQYLEFAHPDIVGMMADFLKGNPPDRSVVTAPPVTGSVASDEDATRDAAQIP